LGGRRRRRKEEKGGGLSNLSGFFLFPQFCTPILAEVRRWESHHHHPKEICYDGHPIFDH
jgi:hypothetical protein